MYIMSIKRSGAGQDDDTGSWASETLPMSVRKEMLERELKKLGFRRAEASHASNSQQQQQPQGQGSHPHADGEKSGDHSQ